MRLSVLHRSPILVSLVFGCIGENPHDNNPAPPLEADEVLCFQELAAALEAHPNKLMQSRISACSDQIWKFRAVRGRDPLVAALESFVGEYYYMANVK